MLNDFIQLAQAALLLAIVLAFFFGFVLTMIWLRRG